MIIVFFFVDVVTNIQESFSILSCFGRAYSVVFTCWGMGVLCLFWNRRNILAAKFVGANIGWDW